MKTVIHTLSVLVAFAATSLMANEDRSIWLQAGQCVVVGGQQVCAQKAPETTTPGAPCPSTPALPNKTSHHCKNGIKDEANPNIKGWAHIVITRGPDGKKISEEIEKTYGPLGKKECMADLEKAKAAN